MRYHKATCVILFGVILNALQTYGVLEINLPPNKVGYYKETTLLNCTDTPFVVANGYSWSKGAVVIYNSVTGDSTGTGKYASSHGTGFFTLEIKDTKLDDKGDYKCSYNFNEADDALEIHAKGSGQGKVEDDKLVITLTEFYPNTSTVSSVICNGKTFTGNSIVTDAGEFFNLVWTSDAVVDTSDLQNDCEVSMSSISPYVIVIAVDIGTTPSPPTAPTTSPQTPSTSPVVIIVSSVVGGAVVIVIICIIVCKLLRKNSDRKKKYRAEEMPQLDVTVTKQQ